MFCLEQLISTPKNQQWKSTKEGKKKRANGVPVRRGRQHGLWREPTPPRFPRGVGEATGIAGVGLKSHSSGSQRQKSEKMFPKRGRGEERPGGVSKGEKTLIKPGLNQPCQLVINDGEHSIIYRTFIKKFMVLFLIRWVKIKRGSTK